MNFSKFGSFLQQKFMCLVSRINMNPYGLLTKLKGIRIERNPYHTIRIIGKSLQTLSLHCLFYHFWHLGQQLEAFNCSGGQNGQTCQQVFGYFPLSTFHEGLAVVFQWFYFCFYLHLNSITLAKMAMVMAIESLDSLTNEMDLISYPSYIEKT